MTDSKLPLLDGVVKGGRLIPDDPLAASPATPGDPVPQIGPMFDQEFHDRRVLERIEQDRIPHALIDTKDGPGAAPPGAGSLLHLGMAVNDNDEETSRQSSNAYLRTAEQSESPYFGRENAWNFGIKLESWWPSW